MLNLSAAPAANPIPGDPMAQASLGANDAWQWIVRGWQLFLKNPVVWVVLTLIYIVSLFVLNMVPVVGALLAAVLTPVLIAWLLFGANELDQGRALTPAHLFQAFQDQPRLLQLALLGMVPLAVTLLQKGVMALSLPQELTTLIGLVLSLAGACVLLFGLPLVMLGNKTAVEAVPASGCHIPWPGPAADDSGDDPARSGFARVPACHGRRGACRLPPGTLRRGRVRRARDTLPAR
jgi:hypothetical protein